MSISRVTTLQTTNTMLGYMDALESNYQKYIEQASSGQAVSEPSDNPEDARNILNINSQTARLKSYSATISTTQNELSQLDSTLSSLNDMISKATDLATQGATGTYDKDSLTQIQTSFDSVIQSIVNNANTDFNGTYLFAGTSSAAPYSVTYDSSGNISAISYNGTNTDADADAYKRYVTISDGVTVAVNANGESIYGHYSNNTNVTTTSTTAGTDSTTVTTSVTTTVTNSSTTTVTKVTSTVVSGTTVTTAVTTTEAAGLFGTLMTTSNALKAGDTKTVSASLTGLSTALNVTNSAAAKEGGIVNRLSLTSSSITETVTNLTSFKSDLSNADLSEVLTNLAATETALKATYQVTSNMADMSLLKYM